ncbi:MAG: hypothetical protein QOJ43_230 [Gaiellaceae bacterium]|nr:hypothetical protein [Gaiellaceae bacterium]
MTETEIAIAIVTGPTGVATAAAAEYRAASPNTGEHPAPQADAPE